MYLTQRHIYPRNAQSKSSYAKLFYLGAQASGDIDNTVVGGNQAKKAASFADATLWANAGYATVGGGANNYCTVDAPTSDVTLNGYSLIVAVTLYKVAGAFPGAENYIYAGYKPGSEFGGIIISCLTSGAARLYLNSTDNTTASLTTAANVLTNGVTPNLTNLVFMAPREVGGTGYIAINGVETVSASLATVAGKSLVGNRQTRLGISLAGVQVDATRVASLQIYNIPKDVSSMARTQIYEWVQRNPHLQIPDWMFEL